MAELMELAREAREQGWWTQYSDLKLDPYIGLEQEASAITSFMMYCLPALLQTEAYARAIIRATAPQMDPKILDQRVEVRLRRQQLLAQDNPPKYRVLLDEAVLHRRVGGPAVMADQVSKVLSLAGDAKATVQVIPFDFGAYAASDSNIVLLEFRESMPPVIFLEGLTNHQYLERASDLDRYREALEHLRDSALSPRASIERIREIREHYF